MKIKLNTLTLACKMSREVIDLSSHISVFYGKISSGKSSIARLIDFCLGGDLEKTPAIQNELLSATLAASIGEYTVTFDRDIRAGGHVRVSWIGPGNEGGSVNASKQASSAPIWGDDIYTFSDLLFYFLGQTPPKVRRSKFDPDSPLVRLSFRDFMEFCYLEQDKLDSSFYKLEVPILKEKSKDVLKFVVGYYSDRLNELEIELEQAKQARLGKTEAIKQIGEFLKKFGFDSESEINKLISEAEQRLADAQKQQIKLQGTYSIDTHPSDHLREQIRLLGDRINRELTAQSDIHEKILELGALKAELLTAKMKISRATTATAILSGVSFEKCPACGSPVHVGNDSQTGEECYLCKNPLPTNEQNNIPQQAEVINTDLTSRIEDITVSLKNFSEARDRQTKIVDQIQNEKKFLDNKLAAMLHDYESVFLANAKETEREIAMLQERIAGLHRLQQMPGAIRVFENEVTDLILKEEEIKIIIEKEKKNLYEAENNIGLLESNYLNALLDVEVPGVNPVDSVKIDSRSWIPDINPGGDQTKSWNFYNAGSGGKKTLLNVLFAIALHQVAVDKKLPLPTFLIIDTPMKNIGKEKNVELFREFYKYLYGLAISTFKETQIIIIDTDYFPPENENIDIFERYMTPSDPDHPPLITYYRGS